MLSEEFISAAKTLLESGLPDEEIKERLIAIAPGSSRGQKCGAVTLALRAVRQAAGDTSVPSIAPITFGPKPSVGSCVEEDEWLRGRIERVIVSDLHIPHARMDLLHYIARKHEGADLIIDGDVMNYEKAGGWPRQERSKSRHGYWAGTDLRGMFDKAVEQLSLITPYFRRMIVIRGNHDDWGAQAMARSMGGDSSLADDYFERRFEEIPNVFVPKNNVRDYYLRKFGDMWVGHFKTHGKPTNKGANNAIEHILSNYELNSMGEWSILVQAHTHKLSDGMHLGKRALECGALTQIPEYSDNNPGKVPPPQLGYVSTIQTDGVTDEMELRLHRFPLKYYTEYMDIEGYQGPVYENLM